MEGLTYPIPFSEPEAVIRIAQHAERLGYHSVWGNDHMTTQHYVRAEFPVPPRFWEPLITHAFVAAHTKTLRLGTGVLVLPMHLPIYFGGNSEKHIRRVAESADGWIPAGMEPERLKGMVDSIRQLAAAAGRGPSKNAIAPQYVGDVAKTDAAAMARFRQ